MKRRKLYFALLLIFGLWIAFDLSERKKGIEADRMRLEYHSEMARYVEDKFSREHKGLIVKSRRKETVAPWGWHSSPVMIFSLYYRNDISRDERERLEKYNESDNFWTGFKPSNPHVVWHPPSIRVEFVEDFHPSGTPPADGEFRITAASAYRACTLYEFFAFQNF